MNVRLRSIAAVLGATVLAATGVVSLAGAASAATTPPWEPDPGSQGSLSFFDASGAPVVGGTITDAPFAAYVQASHAGRVGDTKATLFGYLPKNGQPVGAWAGEQLSASTTYGPVAGAPSGISSTLPVVKLSASDLTIAALQSDFPNDATDAYKGLYQLRLKTSGAGQPVGSDYDSADILITGTTWSLVYPVPSVTATTTTLGVAPTSPQVAGTSVTLTATVSPSTAAGTVQFFDGATAFGTPVAVTSGSAVKVTTTLAVGTHSLKATFIPTDTSAFAGSSSAVKSYVITAAPVSAKYTPAGPCRVFDTRKPTNATCTSAVPVATAPVGAGKVLKVHVAGVQGVPANATAVVLNVTAVGATKATYISVYPDGASQPVVSNLNVANSLAVPNLVVVPLINGQVDFFNQAGSVNLFADLAGYYAPTATNSYTAVGPCRVFDTRGKPAGCTNAPTPTSTPVGTGEVRSITITGVQGVPANATAVVLNVTAVNATKSTFVTVYPDGGAGRPAVSNLNVNSAAPIANLTIVPVVNGKIDFYNYAGSVNLAADLAGYYAPTTGAQYTAVGPCRVFDTRPGRVGGCSNAPAPHNAPIGAQGVLTVTITGVEGVPANATAVVLNVTAVGASASTFVSVYPDGAARPVVSNLNVAAGATVPNLVIVPVINGKIDFFNNLGTVNLLGDIAGYYAP